MDDQQLLRYSRHLMLPEIDIPGQERLLESSVLIAGLGGLGSAAATYLATSGTGHLLLADFDDVESSNLQRQILHDTSSIGRLKTDSAHDRLLALNPGIKLTLIKQKLDGEVLDQAVQQADIIVDASDNFTTRFAINAASVRHHKPLVSAAAIRFEAQISTYDPRLPESPCYQCLYRQEGLDDETCTRNGVLAPLLGIIGSIQAAEVIKLITGIGEPLTGRLMLFDSLEMEWRTIKLNRDPDCPICHA